MMVYLRFLPRLSSSRRPRKARRASPEAVTLEPRSLLSFGGLPAVAAHVAAVHQESLTTLAAVTESTVGSGKKRAITGFAIQFTGPISTPPASAFAVFQENPSHRGQKGVAISSASYDSTTETVRLTVAGKRTFPAGGALEIAGSSLRDVSGLVVDAGNTGTAGSKAIFVFRRNGLDLVGTFAG